MWGKDESNLKKTKSTEYTSLSLAQIFKDPRPVLGTKIWILNQLFIISEKSCSLSQRVPERRQKGCLQGLGQRLEGRGGTSASDRK